MNRLWQGITTTQFFLYGKKSFTQSGYYNHLKSYTSPVQTAAVITDESQSDGVDLTGKTVVVTGANSGIGKEIATYAAAKHANVYMICRNAERAETAKRDIVSSTNNNNVQILLGDVSEPSHIQRIVREFGEDKLDVLVCNAGALFKERRVNSEGKEVTLMSHLVCGSYQLTKLLMPKLKQSNEGKVIYVSSGGMYNSRFPSWEEAASIGEYETKYDGQFAYTYAKRGQVLLAERFAKLYTDVTFVSCHPGWTMTSGVEAAYGDDAKYLKPLRTTWEGSEGICWLMSAPAKNLKSGEFYLDREVQRKHIGGLFMSEGGFTKNSEKDVDTMIERFEKEVGV